MDMDGVNKVSSSWDQCDNDRMVKIEFEAAEALAGLAHVSSESHNNNNVVEQVKDESIDDACNSSFDTFPKSSTISYEDAKQFMVKKSQTTGLLAAKSVKDEQSTELRLDPNYRTNCVSSGRKSRQNLTEAEMEARKIRRVLANRESARQTIRRRQAVFEELTRKSVDLAWENENLKRDKDAASKHYDSLKTKNECLKAMMTRINTIEAEETKEDSITTNEPTISASSTNSPFVIYNQPPFLPIVWPNSVPLQCGQTAGIVFPSHIPISTASNPDSSSCEEGSSMSPLYLLPYPWVVTVPQNNHERRPHSFNLNDKPKEILECNQFFPEKVKSETPLSGFPPDGGGRQSATTDSNLKVSIPAASSVSCEELIEHDHDTNTFLKEHLRATTTKVGDDSEQMLGENFHKIHQVPIVCSGKRLGDLAAATEARKRRKELTRLKNHFHCRQLRMH
uniref:uncharacterized protein LOC122604253 n=1 Tax=Erigeron canadensis TaxID=72917 RepID=UPI001CB98078|nr:uncharacterized protein LOC122604253 [Erigeron canadensis]